MGGDVIVIYLCVCEALIDTKCECSQKPMLSKATEYMRLCRILKWIAMYLSRQRTIALSSGESEIAAVVRGATELLGL